MNDMNMSSIERCLLTAMWVLSLMSKQLNSDVKKKEQLQKCSHAQIYTQLTKYVCSKQYTMFVSLPFCNKKNYDQQHWSWIGNAFPILGIYRSRKVVGNFYSCSDAIPNRQPFLSVFSPGVLKNTSIYEYWESEWESFRTPLSNISIHH